MLATHDPPNNPKTCHRTIFAGCEWFRYSSYLVASTGVLRTGVALLLIRFNLAARTEVRS